MKNITGKYGITHRHIAKWFKYASANSFRNSSAKEDVMQGIESVIRQVEIAIVRKIEKGK